MKGIDVSKHNGDITWNDVKNDGIEFAIIRGGYGQGIYDQKAEYNLKECNRVGIPCGLYWFSYAYNETMARREAEYALSLARKHKIELPIYWDFEYDSETYAKAQKNPVSKDTVIKMLFAFCETIEKNGYYAGNYTNRDFESRYFKDQNKRFDTWLALWTSDNLPSTVPNGYGIHQYWSKGSVNGISTNVDVDVTYIDYPKRIRSYGRNNLAKEKTEIELAVEWAKKNGISDSADMEKSITIEQLLLILYRLFKAKE